MKSAEQKNVLVTITEKYDEIFKAEKKVADFILKNPELAIDANVSELANFSGVSDATVIRLCKHLGYSGYYQMKICLSRDIGRQDSPINAEEETADTSVGAYFKRMGEQIGNIGTAIEEDSFWKIVKLLKNSSRVYLIAQGNTAPLAMYTSFRLERLGIRCSANLQPEYFINHINLAQRDESVLAISWSGTSKSVVKAMELARERELKVAAITGYRYSPVSRMADYLLLSAAESGHIAKNSPHSRVGEMAVLDTLLYALEGELPKKDNNMERPEMLLSADKF